MKKNLTNLLCRGVLVAIILFTVIFSSAAQALYVDVHGQLSVSNGQLVDKDGKVIQLKGMSLFWSCFPEGTPYFNENTVKNLWNNWKVTVVRIPLGVAAASPNKGYEVDPTTNQNLVTAVVDACIKNGIYAIIDFHAHEADLYKTQANTFFTAMATKYKNVPNVLYETWNEPLDTKVWSTTVKPYHDAIVSTIHGISPNAVILCGTSNWDQVFSGPESAPVTGSNIMYTMHFYAGSTAHYLSSTWLGANTKAAVAAKLPLFVTEYGDCDALGNGSYNTTETQNWWTYLDANHISYCNWGVYNKNETAAALQPGTTSAGNWTNANLTTSGIFVLTHTLAGYDGTLTGTETAVEQSMGLNVFPNPSNSDFTLNCEGSFSYSVLDNAGRTIESGNGFDSKVFGDFLVSGSYILSIQSDKGKAFHKLIKN